MARRVDYDSPRVMAEARRKLAEMYAAEDTAGRTHIGRKLAYKGKPANIRRSVRRLAQFTIKEGEETNLNRYFRPYTTIEEPDPYLGIAPPFSITGMAQIQAYVMFLVRREQGGFTYFETFPSWINTPMFDNMNEGMKAFSHRVDMLYFDPDELMRLGMRGYPGLEAIAFSADGVEQLLSLPEYEGEMPPREPLDNYGISLHSTKHSYKGAKKLPFAPPSVTGRPFPSRPKGRRKEIIQYINRSYAARKRGGMEA